jgi:hypothetical protein
MSTSTPVTSPTDGAQPPSKSALKKAAKEEKDKAKKALKEAVSTKKESNEEVSLR